MIEEIHAALKAYKSKHGRPPSAIRLGTLQCRTLDQLMHEMSPWVRWQDTPAGPMLFGLPVHKAGVLDYWDFLP